MRACSSRGLLGSNSHKLSLMKLHPPDPNADPDDIVIMESEGDNLEENAFKVLEFSATKNGMLLSWRQLDKGNAPGSFRYIVFCLRNVPWHLDLHYLRVFMKHSDFLCLKLSSSYFLYLSLSSLIFFTCQLAIYPPQRHRRSGQYIAGIYTMVYH